jgi:hypothetical protein
MKAAMCHGRFELKSLFGKARHVKMRRKYGKGMRKRKKPVSAERLAFSGERREETLLFKQILCHFRRKGLFP